MVRNETRAGVAAGVLGIATTGVALVSSAAFAQNPDTRLPLFLDDRSVVVGERVEASGRPGRDFAGRTVVLEHSPRGGAWTQIGTATVNRNGVYRIRRAIPRPGALRATLQAPPGAATAATGTRTSSERSVRVAPRVGLATRRLHVKSGRRAVVAGRVGTGAPRQRVSLQVYRGSRWVTIDRARTRDRGRFALRDRRSRPMSAPVRVAVGPHAGLSAGRRRVGRLNVYRYAQASWYGPGLYGNSLACGGRLHPGTLGVAHKTLPCGTKVTFRRGGRVVRVRVIDRGPYVGGREYDLTQATAQRLGFSGHGAVLTTR